MMEPMATPTFLKLQDLVLAPPLPALVSMLMVAGIAYLGWHLARGLQRERAELVDVAAGFVVCAAIIAALVHGMALAQLARVAILRVLAWALAATGGVALFVHRVPITAALRREATNLWSATRFERAGAILALLAVVGLGAAALGPPTDPDSINYHLGVPLDWLRHGGAYHRTDWFCTRLVGVAESLNMLGLAGGTDSLGACLQWSGMIAAALAVRTFATSSSDRLLAWLLVAACPSMAFLVPNQKPMMLPAAATTIAAVLAVRRYSDFRITDAVLAFGCCAFAAASKLSFLLSVGFVALLCLAAARRSGRLLPSAGVGVGALAALMLPVLARNYVFFGDPISPFLERFRPHPDPALLEFAHYLRVAEGEATLSTLAMLPVRILGTLHPGHISTVLGIGALAFVPALRLRGAPRMLLRAALAAAVTSAVLGQIAPRFFLEPYLWAGAALVAAGASRGKNLLRGALTLQAGVAGAVALFGAATLFPGALTAHRRTAVLERSAAGYTQSEWLDRVLPADALFVDPGLFHLFAPRPFVAPDPYLVDSPVNGDATLAALVRDSHANSLVIVDSNGNDAFARLAGRCGEMLAPPGVFALAMRNPWNAQTYEAQAFRLRGCDPNAPTRQRP